MAAADVDPLTRLANRRWLDADFPSAVDRADRTSSPLSINVLGIAHVQSVDDSDGHDQGDRLLLAAAHAWSARQAPGDVPVRRSRDEFVVVLPGPAGGVRPSRRGLRERVDAPADAALYQARNGRTTVATAAGGAGADGRQGRHRTGPTGPLASLLLLSSLHRQL